MILTKKSLFLAFMLTLLLTLFSPTLFPKYLLFFFSPFLIISYYKLSYAKALWLSLFCGTVLDLFSQSRLGLLALSYTLTTMILYNQRRNFFADSLSTLPIMTFFFSFFATSIYAIILYVVELKAVISWPWIWTDLILFPTADAFFAFAFFILPFKLFGKTPRRGKDYFLQQNDL